MLRGSPLCTLQWAGSSGIDVRLLSDCNTVFIGHMLTGARISSVVSEVITNFASFQRVAGIQVHLRASLWLNVVSPYSHKIAATHATTFQQ